MGVEGKWRPHPRRIGLANRVGPPAEGGVDRARGVLEGREGAAKAGRGAVSRGGRLIDIASIRMAEALIEKADAMTG